MREQKLIPFLKNARVDMAAIDPQVKRGVEKLQRVLRLTGEYRHAETLLAAGYSASADIVAAGKTQFIADVRRGDTIGTAEAERIFEVAESNNIATIALAGNIATLSWPTALEGTSAPMLAQHISKIVADQPDLAALFGANDACE